MELDPALAALEKEHEEITKVKNIRCVEIGRYEVDTQVTLTLALTVVSSRAAPHGPGAQRLSGSGGSRRCAGLPPTHDAKRGGRGSADVRPFARHAP